MHAGPDDYFVREASRGDVQQLVDFTVAEAAEAEGRQLDHSLVERAVTASIDDPHLARYWIVESPDRQIVGAIAVVSEWSDWRNTAYWWIQFVFLLPEVRGRALLSKLTSELERIGRLHGVPELRLYVHPQNARAIRAYQKLGFVRSPYRIMAKELPGTTELGTESDQPG